MAQENNILKQPPIPPVVPTQPVIPTPPPTTPNPAPVPVPPTLNKDSFSALTDSFQNTKFEENEPIPAQKTQSKSSSEGGSEGSKEKQTSYNKNGVPASTNVLTDSFSYNPQYDDSNARDVARTIRLIESTNDYNKPGASGEFGAYQFTAPTWRTRAIASGVDKKWYNLSSKPPQEIQDKVAYDYVEELLQDGNKLRDILSIWNSGLTWEGGGATRVGKNDFGVEYDTPAHVEKGLLTYDNLKKLEGNMSNYDRAEQKAQYVMGLDKAKTEDKTTGEEYRENWNGFVDSIAERWKAIKTDKHKGSAIANFGLGGLNDLVGSIIESINDVPVIGDVTSFILKDVVGGAVGGVLEATGLDKKIAQASKYADENKNKDGAKGFFASLIDPLTNAALLAPIAFTGGATSLATNIAKQGVGSTVKGAIANTVKTSGVNILKSTGKGLGNYGKGIFTENALVSSYDLISPPVKKALNKSGLGDFFKKDFNKAFDYDTNVNNLFNEKKFVDFNPSPPQNKNLGSFESDFANNDIASKNAFTAVTSQSGFNVDTFAQQPMYLKLQASKLENKLVNGEKKIISDVFSKDVKGVKNFEQSYSIKQGIDDIEIENKKGVDFDNLDELIASNDNYKASGNFKESKKEKLRLAKESQDLTNKYKRIKADADLDIQILRGKKLETSGKDLTTEDLEIQDVRARQKIATDEIRLEQDRNLNESRDLELRIRESTQKVGINDIVADLKKNPTIENLTNTIRKINNPDFLEARGGIGQVEAFQKFNKKLRDILKETIDSKIKFIDQELAVATKVSDIKILEQQKADLSALITNRKLQANLINAAEDGGFFDKIISIGQKQSIPSKKTSLLRQGVKLVTQPLDTTASGIEGLLIKNPKLFKQFTSDLKKIKAQSQRFTEEGSKIKSEIKKTRAEKIEAGVKTGVKVIQAGTIVNNKEDEIDK